VNSKTGAGYFLAVLLKKTHVIHKSAIRRPDIFLKKFFAAVSHRRRVSLSEPDETGSCDMSHPLLRHAATTASAKSER